MDCVPNPGQNDPDWDIFFLVWDRWALVRDIICKVRDNAEFPGHEKIGTTQQGPGQ